MPFPRCFAVVSLCLFVEKERETKQKRAKNKEKQLEAASIPEAMPLSAAVRRWKQDLYRIFPYKAPPTSLSTGSFGTIVLILKFFSQECIEKKCYRLSGIFPLSACNSKSIKANPV